MSFGMTREQLHSLKLHECDTVTAHTSVMRVPSGWIYTSCYIEPKGNGTDMMSITSTFVPEKL